MKRQLGVILRRMNRERVEHAAYVACAARSYVSAALTPRSAKPPRGAIRIPPSPTVSRDWNAGALACKRWFLLRHSGWYYAG